ncbi:hypothetical protein [Chryseobacterium wangxinyae]|uniref:hypothetical protein n=1 Tax=Chryseobacterium sp. CY353 TaxID=2997334 RepID=UPI00226D7359|nr:hypothetical protein [Chryseobacterium sp. CY353]MCY0967896.1 hypothetical protein [Chryseobacterium sp. CY353]
MADREKIKELFLKLDSQGKDKVRKQISDKYKVSIDTVKNHWIYKNETPLKNVPAVLNIIRTVAQRQVKEIQKLIDVL